MKSTTHLHAVFLTLIFKLNLSKQKKIDQRKGCINTWVWSCVTLIESIWWPGHCVMLNSGNGYMAMLPELHKKKGLFGTTTFKHKWQGWPRGSDAIDIVCHMQEKEVYKDKYQHTTIMMNTWATINKYAEHKRRFGWSLVTINYGQYFHWYYFVHHAVENNSNNGQGHLSFEAIFTQYRWDLRQLGFVIAISQANLILVYNYFWCTATPEPMLDTATLAR